MAYVRRGVRYKRLRMYPSRWGEGKVHLMIYRRDYKQWVKACRFDDISILGEEPRGVDVNDDEAITCRVCQRIAPHHDRK